MTVKELRKRTGLSQSKFAAKFRLNIKTLQAWEQNVRHTPDYIICMLERLIDNEYPQSEEIIKKGTDT